MSVKEIVVLVLSTLLPVVYSLIQANNPDFPLTQSQFVELILYILGGIIDTAVFQNFRVKARTGKSIKQL